MEDEFTLVELAGQLGIQPRTIRSYIEQGLLRGPEIGGRGARYGTYHLQRLQAIRTLKEDRGLPLAEVRRVLLAMSASDISALSASSDEESAPPARAESALNYLRNVQGRLPSAEPLPSAPPQGPTPVDALLARLDRAAQGSKPARKARGEVWTSVPVTKDIELRVRGVQPAGRLARWERIADHLREILMGEAGED